MAIRVGDRVRISTPVAYRGRFGRVESVRRWHWLHPSSGYTVRLQRDDFTPTAVVITAGRIRRVRWWTRS